MHSSSVPRVRQSGHCMSVWNWENQFDEQTIALFRNPLYQTSAAASGQCWTLPRYASSCTHGHAGGHMTAPSLTTCQSVTVIRPRHHLPELQVWSLCYLRWLTPLQIVNGGSPAELMTQRDILSEIEWLQRDIARLSEDEMTSSRRPGHHQQQQSQVEMSLMTQQQHVSSSYPFAACPAAQSTCYCMTSSVRLSYNDDSVSIDEISVTDWLIYVSSSAPPHTRCPSQFVCHHHQCLTLWCPLLPYGYSYKASCARPG